MRKPTASSIAKQAFESFKLNVIGPSDSDLRKHDLAKIKALLWIFEFQTNDEQAQNTTNEYNGVGFTGIDADILSSFAKQVHRKHYLSEKQMVILRKKMPKYARQMYRISTGGRRSAKLDITMANVYDTMFKRTDD